MEEWINLSLEVDENITTFNDLYPFKRIIKKSIDLGDACNESRLDIGCHTGTHIDAPYHFNNQGKRIHELDLSTLIGECYVCEIFNRDTITYDDLARADIPTGIIRLFIKTDNSIIGFDTKFRRDYVGLDVSAIKFIHERGILLLGTDYFAISSYNLSAQVHCEFFKNNECIALEALNLAPVSKGSYTVICLPLNLKNADGSPARVVARRLEQ